VSRYIAITDQSVWLFENSYFGNHYVIGRASFSGSSEMEYRGWVEGLIAVGDNFVLTDVSGVRVTSGIVHRILSVGPGVDMSATDLAAEVKKTQRLRLELAECELENVRLRQALIEVRRFVVEAAG